MNGIVPLVRTILIKEKNERIITQVKTTKNSYFMAIRHFEFHYLAYFVTSSICYSPFTLLPVFGTVF